MADSDRENIAALEQTVIITNLINKMTTMTDTTHTGGGRRIRRIFALTCIGLGSGNAATLSTGFTGPYHGKETRFFCFLFCLKTLTRILFQCLLPADGNLFTLEAKSNQISIRGFDINVDAGSTTIEVYSRPGVIVTNNYDNGWFLLQTAQVTGQGKGNTTPLPDFVVPINIPAFSKQSFYVTSADEKDVWYHIGQQLGQAYATDDNLNVLEGYALGYGFVGASGPRRWNGEKELQH